MAVHAPDPTATSPAAVASSAASNSGQSTTQVNAHAVGIDHVEAAGDLDAGRTEQGARRLGRTRREEDAVARLRPDMRGEPVAFGVGEILGHRPSE